MSKVEAEPEDKTEVETGEPTKVIHVVRIERRKTSPLMLVVLGVAILILWWTYERYAESQAKMEATIMSATMHGY